MSPASVLLLFEIQSVRGERVQQQSQPKWTTPPSAPRWMWSWIHVGAGGFDAPVAPGASFSSCGMAMLAAGVLHYSMGAGSVGRGQNGELK